MMTPVGLTMIVGTTVLQQELLPSAAPYTLLDYGVSAITLVVLGIALWFVFRTQRTILADHDKHEAEMVDAMHLIKDGLIQNSTSISQNSTSIANLAIDTRHLHDVMNRNDAHYRDEDIRRDARVEQQRHLEQEHRREATDHVADERRKP